jgi:hypothetical protein
MSVTLLWRPKHYGQGRLVCAALGGLLLTSKCMPAQNPSMREDTRSGRLRLGFMTQPESLNVMPRLLSRANVLSLADDLPLLRRGRFETTTEFRLRAAARGIPGVYYALPLPTQGDNWCLFPSLSYDVDSARFEVGLPSELHVLCTRNQLGTYNGINAFGVNRTVHRSAVTVVTVRSQAEVLLRERRRRSDHDLMQSSYSVAMPRANARSVEKSLALALVIKPIADDSSGEVVTRRRGRSRPTLDAPDEVTVYDIALLSADLWLVLYDARTRRVIDVTRAGKGPFSMADSAQFVGDFSTRVFGPRLCPTVQKIEYWKREYFLTAEAATKAGFRIAGDCDQQAREKPAELPRLK